MKELMFRDLTDAPQWVAYKSFAEGKCMNEQVIAILFGFTN